jgi:hypothetical protein
MIAVMPQMRLLVAVEPVDFRNHSACLIIPSSVRKAPTIEVFPDLLHSVARNNQRP